MDFKILILFFTAFTFKNIHTSPSAHSSSKYDITETLQNSIQSIYSSFDNTWKFFSRGQCKAQELTFTSEVGNKTYFVDLSLALDNLVNLLTLSTCMNTSKVVLTIRGLMITNKGWIIEKNPKRKYFTDLRIYFIENTRFESNGSNGLSVISKRDYDPHLSDYGEAKHLTEGSLKQSILNHTRNKLEATISALLQEFVADLGNNTRTIFTLNHPDFLHNEEQHYYFIPNVSVICFHLKNITIKGLTNFHSFKMTKEQPFCNLSISNIRGEVVLDYGSEIETPMMLNFDADYFTISFNSSKPAINVELKNYRIFRTTPNATLNDHQSAILIQHIESELASSLMPSMEVWWKTDQQSRKYDKEFSGGDMFMAMLQHTDLDTKRKALNKWIPFNDDHNISKN